MKEMKEEKSKMDEAMRMEADNRRMEEIFSMKHQGLFDFPSNEIPHGWTYRFLVSSVKGHPMNDTIDMYKKLGWTEVPATRHPNYPAAKRCIEEGLYHILNYGQILFEMQTKWVQKYEEKRMEYQNQIMKGLPQEEQFKTQHGIITSKMKDPMGTAYSF